MLIDNKRKERKSFYSGFCLIDLLKSNDGFIQSNEQCAIITILFYIIYCTIYYIYHAPLYIALPNNKSAYVVRCTQLVEGLDTAMCHNIAYEK